MPARRVSLAPCRAAALALTLALVHAPGAARAQQSAPEVALEVAVNRPDTRVLVDRAFVGYAPWAGRVTAGPHRVRLEHDAFRPWEDTVLVPPGETQQLRAVLRPPPPRTAARWTLVSAGGSALLGALFGALAFATRAGLEQSVSLGRLEERDGRVLAGTAYAVTADALWGCALGLAGAGIYLAFLDPPPRSSARLGPLRRPRVADVTTESAPPADEAP